MTPHQETSDTVKAQTLPQKAYGVDVFRQRLPTIRVKNGIAATGLSKAFYLSVGMVLNADEKKHKGEFTIDDLLSDRRDQQHAAAFVGSKDVDEFGIRRVRYLEYGKGTRVPAKVRRPTFPELYNRDKLMVGEFGGFALDNGVWDKAGHLKCNHSVFILMPWHLLKGVKNNSISAELKEIGKISRETLEATSKAIDPWYVLGFLNSAEMHELLTGVARSAIADRRQPDDLRKIIMPLLGKDITERVAQAARKAVQAQKSLLPFRLKGWDIQVANIKPAGSLPSKIKAQPLSIARVSWGLAIHIPSAKVGTLARSGRDVFRGKQKVMSAPEVTRVEALDWLVHQLNTLPDGTTLESAEHEQVLIPSTPKDAVVAFAGLESEKATVRDLLQAISKAKAEISLSLKGLFETIKHPPIRVIQQGLT